MNPLEARTAAAWYPSRVSHQTDEIVARWAVYGGVVLSQFDTSPGTYSETAAKLVKTN